MPPCKPSRIYIARYAKRLRAFSISALIPSGRRKSRYSQVTRWPSRYPACVRSQISGWRDRALFSWRGWQPKTRRIRRPAAGRSVMSSRAAPAVSYRDGSSKRPLAPSAGGEAGARLMMGTGCAASANDPKLSHAEALRQFMLAMIDAARSNYEANPGLWAVGSIRGGRRTSKAVVRRPRQGTILATK
jgi:hypothetical protein